ncbi:hypothetical protein [Kineosporia succinea]|uniref:Uncharacterized protein n=1 Tax=Kineosporia succinea TaxID=84632 RepID=A0ABT9NZX5_9ACTN|nr:hypothetical protein [Kineosporia succinea]MDP9825978.1 hypothetical protein [Kineosporia succinea]
MTENTPVMVRAAWLAVVLGVVGNSVASVAGDLLLLNLAFGTLTAVGVVTLVLNWMRRR